MSKHIPVVECTRDAIQGMHKFIPTERKIRYINELIKSAYFEYIDFGSFVSPKAVPQMQDTAAVLEGIEKVNETKLLAIIANERGAITAAQYGKLDFVGYPFSISETFQQRNANSTIAESLERVKKIKEILAPTRIELVIYISMAFGNPYGDTWNEELVLQWIETLHALDINRFSIADTTAEATPLAISSLYRKITVQFPNLELSIHLHSPPQNAREKIDAAWKAGCTRFEGALAGYGGCPFAKDEPVGNIPTELLLEKFGIGTTALTNRLKADFQQMIG